MTWEKDNENGLDALMTGSFWIWAANARNAARFPRSPSIILTAANLSMTRSNGHFASPSTAEKLKKANCRCYAKSATPRKDGPQKNQTMMASMICLHTARRPARTNPFKQIQKACDPKNSSSAKNNQRAPRSWQPGVRGSNVAQFIQAKKKHARSASGTILPNSSILSLDKNHLYRRSIQTRIRQTTSRLLPGQPRLGNP